MLQVAAPVQLRLHLEVFEGPLELLLSLIEQRRLPISRISLARVADQYLEQVHALPSLDPDLLADFLSIGGRLLLLKSRALLLTDEADPAAEESASDLEQRLAEYRIFREAALHLQALEQRAERTYPTSREPTFNAAPPPFVPPSLELLASTWKRLQRQKPREVEVAAISRASVDERRAWILDLLRRRPRIPFSEIAGETVDEVVAAFLAILELFRRGRIHVEQTTLYGELTLSRV